MIAARCQIHDEAVEPNEITGSYECSSCNRERSRDKLTFFVVITILAVLLLIGCTTDYRTDYEKAQNIVLTEEQVDLRKWYDSERLKAQQAVANEAAFREALRRCSTRRIVECL